MSNEELPEVNRVIVSHGGKVFSLYVEDDHEELVLNLIKDAIRGTSLEANDVDNPHRLVERLGELETELKCAARALERKQQIIESMSERSMMLDITDLRESGWYVSAHYDYTRDHRRYTSWCLRKHGEDEFVLGTGQTDAEAIQSVRRQILERYPVVVRRTDYDE